MKVLLLGGDTPIGYSLKSFMVPLQRHDVQLIPLEATRWGRERHLKKLLRRAECDLILDARILTAATAYESLTELDLERTEWLAQLSDLMGIRYLLLSSARVFSGALQRPYRETDIPDAGEEDGRLLIVAEKMLQEHLENTLVLRLGSVFSGRAPSIMTNILGALRNGEQLIVSSRLKSSPVHSAEVARVASGVIDQIGAGAPCEGVYHYCSEGQAGFDVFTEAVVACASQFEAFSNARDLIVYDDDESQPIINRSLDCEKIRHNFGIQQLTWRDFVQRAVKRYIDLYMTSS